MKSLIRGSFKHLVFPSEFSYPIDWSRHFDRRAPLEVEIGFGFGEVLIKKSQEFPQRNFIGFEQNWERIYKTILTIHSSQKPFANICILKVDAKIALQRFFRPKTIDKIYSLFPCPWPKKVHIKHRLFSQKFLKLVNSRLKQNGELHIVTDYQEYANWIEMEAAATGFRFQRNVISPRYGTKFENKWLLKGQKEFFELTFTKQKHIPVTLTKETLLKAYVLKDFDPDRFVMEKETGEISVIFKEFLYDSKKRKGLVHVVVSELDLIQHFWVAIVKKGKVWHLGRADGQNFFQTPGINQALKFVYEAALRSCS